MLEADARGTTRDEAGASFSRNFAALRFLNPHAAIDVTRHHLPHWQQDAKTYFVTFRLADAIPSERLAAWRREREIWIRLHPLPWTPAINREYQRRFSRRIEEWLDRMHGSCLLRSEQARRVVAGALMYFEGARTIQHAWIVMPNHVHVLFSAIEGFRLERILQSWKGYSSRAIGQATGRSGAVWQRDYFDRMIRNETHFLNAARYIRNNPDKAHLKACEYALYESPLVKLVLG